jgi:hypothetical protein
LRNKYSKKKQIKLAPIILFVYNRPLHTEKVITALNVCDDADVSDLYIFHDGLKVGSDSQSHLMVKEIINRKWNFNTITVINRNFNFGLAENIINGVSEILAKHDKIIVLEDDILPRKGFLNYMNDALNMYKDSLKVGCVHAWNRNMDIFPKNQQTFFLRGGDCWGWGTWKRAWDKFDWDGLKLLESIKGQHLEYSFNRNGTMDFVKMLEGQISGQNQSWAVRWHASLFLAGMFCLHPTIGIVENIGLDGSGVHCGANNIKQRTRKYIKLKIQPVEECQLFFEHFKSQGIKLRKGLRSKIYFLLHKLVV